MKFLTYLINKLEGIDPRAEIHNHGHRCYSEGLNSHEQKLVALLAKNLDPAKYFIFNNITLPSSSTITSQIDHVIVSEYGIFVIESKDFQGWIYASDNQPKWTRVLYRHKKLGFQNPIFQNFAHVSALKEQLPFLSKCFFSVVVFSRNSEFKTPRISKVLYDDELVEFIKTKNKKWLSEEEMMMAIGKLSLMCQSYRTTQEEHIKNLNKIHANNEFDAFMQKGTLQRS